MNLRYEIPRLVRHFLPEALTRFLLRRSWIISAGVESSHPQQAVERYQRVLEGYQRDLTEKRVLVFGYGGRLGIGIELLKHGARHVILCDKYAHLEDHLDSTGLLSSSPFVQESGGQIHPHPDWITVSQGDIREIARDQDIAPVDIVLSSSVYEHLPEDELDGITSALAELTSPGGIQVHFIDLRDHFFKYPFEMLTFSKKTWERWLDPTSHLNRCRLPTYRQVFEAHLNRVEIVILESDPTNYERIRSRIRPEFLSDDPGEQAATLIRVVALR